MVDVTVRNQGAGRRLRRVLLSPLRRHLPGAARGLISVFHVLIRLSPHGSVNFYPGAGLPWVAHLETHWPSIRVELDAMMSEPTRIPNVQDIFAGQEALAQDDKWKAVTLCRGMGVWDEANVQRCPQTLQALQNVPGLTHAMFSILAPHKHIPAHRGAYGGMLDVHLGLLVPEPADRCRIRVGSETASWQEGRVLIFDDSHDHEVWNDTDGFRAVLLMYVVRPLPFPLAQINLWVMRLVSRVL